MADAMDSKSISREGVGVQVPASAPRAGSDELARVLLPALLHRLNNVTQVLAGVNSLVRVSGSPAALVERAGDLEHAGGALERLGWLVGALARGMGTGIGAPREDERALEWLVDLLAESLRREGRELSGPRTLPRADFAQSWELARGLLAAACASAPGSVLAWSVRLEGQRLVLLAEERA